MPLVDPNPIVIQPSTTPVVVEKTPYRGVTVNTKYIDSSNLLTHVEGSSWTVNFYSQILDTDSALSGQQINKNAIYQSYRLIEKLELKVTGPLNTSQDNAGKTLTIVGSANVYPFITPNEGDMFTADIGDGREGIFRVTLSDRKSVFKNTIHVIEYVLIDTSANDTYLSRIGDLNMKVIDTFIFVRDFLNYGQNPLLRNDEYANIQELEDHYHDLVNRYFKSFISNEYKTIIVPGQDYPIYDHFLVKAIMAFFTSNDSSDIRNIRILNVDDDEAMKVTTIWDVLRAKDRKMLKYAVKKTGLVSAKTFTKNPMMEGIYHSGIHYVIYPEDPIVSVDYHLTHITKSLLPNDLIVDTPSQIVDLNDLIGDNQFEGLTLPESPAIKTVLVDDYYVLSEDFYNNNQIGQSLLEQAISNYLDDKVIDNTVLLTLARTAHAWGGIERLYFTIILLVLIRSSIRNI